LNSPPLSTAAQGQAGRAIKEASKLIADCPDPQRQWLAMRQLRLLQERLNYPAI
jgi:hypothetical protein